MFYKNQAECSKIQLDVMSERLMMQQSNIDRLITDNRTLTNANIRGANLVNMKHEAGMMYQQSMDRMADLLGTVRREVPEFTAYCPEVERILLRADFASHMLHGVNFVDLTADEELTEEETEDDVDEVEL